MLESNQHLNFKDDLRRKGIIMKFDKLDKLIAQINKVILMLNERPQNNYGPMIELILKRYQNAKELLENTPKENLQRTCFKIDGSVRAYLEISSNYMNPLLEELNKSERLLDEVFSSEY